MKVFLSDGQLLKRGGHLRLVKLYEQWHVAGEGYLCMVASYEEGLQLIERLHAEGRERGVAIEMQQKQVRAS